RSGEEGARPAEEARGGTALVDVDRAHGVVGERRGARVPGVGPSGVVADAVEPGPERLLGRVAHAQRFAHALVRELRAIRRGAMVEERDETVLGVAERAP